MGCYKDTSDRAFPNYHRTNGTVEGCYKEALELGYEVFGVQNKGECWLDGAKKNNYDKHGESPACRNGIGGVWANDVYRINSMFIIISGVLYWSSLIEFCKDKYERSILSQRHSNCLTSRQTDI